MHKISCPSTADERPRARCGCPFNISVPGAAPGTRRTVTVRGTLTEAKNRKRTLDGLGRLA